MLRSDTLFGKREGAAGNALNPPLSNSSSLARPGAPTMTAAQAESARIAAAAAATAAAAPNPASNPAPVVSNGEGGSKLIVGPNIKLKGVEITDCDTIVIEGFVEATIYSRVIQISHQGAFKGSAEIDIAEIRGIFDGDLTVREKLVICSTGKVSGKIRYGKLVVEEGGQLSGDVQMDLPGTAKSVAVPTLTEQIRHQAPANAA